MITPRGHHGPNPSTDSVRAHRCNFDTGDDRANKGSESKCTGETKEGSLESKEAIYPTDWYTKPRIPVMTNGTVTIIFHWLQSTAEEVCKREQVGFMKTHSVMSYGDHRMTAPTSVYLAATEVTTARTKLRLTATMYTGTRILRFFFVGLSKASKLSSEFIEGIDNLMRTNRPILHIHIAIKGEFVLHMELDEAVTGIAERLITPDAHELRALLDRRIPRGAHATHPPLLLLIILLLHPHKVMYILREHL